MRKRLLAILLTLGMALALLPTSALAYVGAKWDTGGAQSFGTDGSRFYMENDYIYFSVFNTSPDFLELKAKNDTSAGHSGITLEFFVEYPGQAKREMYIESATLNTDGAQNSGMVTAVFTFGNDHYQTPGDVEMTYTVNYQLVRLDEGDTGRGTVTEPIMKVDGDDGTTWALFADGEFEFEGESLPLFAGDEHAMVSVRASLLWFSNFGHPEYDGEVPVAPVMLSKADRDYSGPVITEYNTTNISQGLDWMATNPSENDTEYYITEVFVDSYTYANPFVATSQFYDYFDTFGDTNDQGVWGFEGVRFPTQICYERDDDFGSNYAYSCLMVETETAFHEPNNPQTADLLIGYRDLVNTQEDELPTDPDKVTVSSSADRLAVYADGTVTPYSGRSGITGNPVAVIRGDFKLENDAYNFTGGAAALSPTVTATWDDGGYFRITTSGQVQQSGVHLNAPSFKFYLPQSGHDSDLRLEFDSGGLQMSNMSNNGAVLNIDIPGTSTSVTSGTATVNGGLSFKGELSFNNMFSQEALEMTELSYALKNGVFTVNGVRANGMFDSVSLLGFTLGEVTGSIDTIDDVYDFQANINVFSLLEASGELQLKRTDSGELMPNNLYFEVDSAVGIPLVPPVPVVKLTGGGAGFYGLADTANGDWYAIPPLKFRGSVNAEIVEFLEADGANIVLGPSEFELSVDALKIAGTSFAAFSGGIGMYLGGDKVTYNSTEYTGLSASGRIWLDIDLPSQRLNFLVFDGELAASIFGGMDGNNLYMRATGNSHASAALQFPDGWPLVGGWNLLGVGVDTAVVADTLIQGSSDYGSTIESAFNNLNLQVGLAATGSFLGSDVRVWVILPDVAQNSREDWNWGWDFKFWGSLDRWSWDNTAMGTLSANTAPRLLALASGTTPALLADGDNETASKTITVSNVDDGETAYLVLSFPEDTVIDLSEVSVTKSEDGYFSFTPVQIDVDEDNSITNGDDANIMSGVMPLKDKDGTGNEHVLIIKLGEGSSYNGTYTVSLGDNDSAINPVYSKANVVAPADGLGAMGVSDGGNIEVDVEYLEAEANYILRTYLGTEASSADYLVDERAVEELSNGTMRFEIPTSGTAAPSGNYYVTTYLLKEISYTPDGANEPETAYIAIDYASNSSTQVTYTNSEAPAAPATVELKAVGNEVMTASWKAPANATNVDGYKIVIYEQGGNGNWVDSGFGYEYDASQFSTMPGLSYDKDAKTYSIDMALTMGGASSEDGTAITLPAGKSYKVGVSAYNSESVTIVNKTQNVKYYGPEAQSAEAYLPEYVPLDITMQYHAVGITSFELMADTETGIYSLGVSERDSSSSNNRLGLIQLSGDKSALYTVTRMDNNNQITVDGSNEFYIPDFEGMLMLEITGSVTNDDGITDTTTRYLLISRDDTAPIITLDEDVFYADENGSYTITGVTEPGAIVEMSGYYGESVADTDGTFSLTGTLTSGSSSALLAVTATDTAGNEGTDDALVTTSPATTSPAGTVESVTVSPASANVARGGQQQFTATVVGTGTYDHTVTWSVIGNASTGTSITSGGLLTVAADETAAHLTVTATSSADASKTASSTVTVGTYIPPVPSYRVTIGDTANGTVTASPAAARQGATVTLTVTPEEGYAVDEITVTDFFGNRVEVSRNSNGTYSFVMPYSQVEVDVTFTRTEEPIRFTDVPEGAYYCDAVYWAVENGVTVGATATTFNPGGSCTRAQMVTFLWRAAGSPEPATTVNPFTDVDANDYYYEAVLWAVENGVTVGATATTFNPGGECTRSQMVTFLWRAAGEPGTGTSSNPFTDVDADDYYCEAVLWAVENGITVGATATTFAPVAVCTRAQAVTFLYRAQG